MTLGREALRLGSTNLNPGQEQHHLVPPTTAALKALNSSEATPGLTESPWFKLVHLQASIKQKCHLDLSYHLGTILPLVLDLQSGSAYHGGLDTLSTLQIIHCTRATLRHAFCEVAY